MFHNSFKIAKEIINGNGNILFFIKILKFPKQKLMRKVAIFYNASNLFTT